MSKTLKFKFIVVISICWIFKSNAQITLTQNVGNTPIVTAMTSCEDDESWSRIFQLSDFGIKPNEQFIIRSGQVALSKSSSGARLSMHISSIHGEFPAFYTNENPLRALGGRGYGQSPVIDGSPQIVDIDFVEPVVVPAGVERILVTVSKVEDFYNPESAEVIIAGTQEDRDQSWYFGCRTYYNYTPTTEMDPPVPDANFFINVTGDVSDVKRTGSTTRLSHNLCDDIIKTNIHSCTSAYIYWARDFYLSDFGISNDETYTITSGQIGINEVGWLPEISFNIYEIDNNFPTSFSETDSIGSSQYQQLSPNIGRDSEIVQVEFETPIVVPANVKRILVEVHKGIVYGDGVAFIAGSTVDKGESWQRGCIPLSGGPYNEYVSTDFFGKPDANFYINVTGNVNHISNSFQMEVSNICSEFLKEFSVTNQQNINSITWNFGDPASGTTNTSNDHSPYHDFSEDGTFIVTATVVGNDGRTEHLSETIDVKEPPKAYGIDNVYACEDTFGSGMSSSFDLSHVKHQVLGGQTNKEVIFITGNGSILSGFPSLYTNTVKDRETISVRVAHDDQPCCYSETTFDLIVHPIPDMSPITDLVVCSNGTDGFSTFDLEQLQNEILAVNNHATVSFFRENDNPIQPPLNAIENQMAREEVIRVQVSESTNNCYNEATFKLLVNPLPIAQHLDVLVGCDDDNDGISEYFDTSGVESQVLNGQTGMSVSYFDQNGNDLPNPYTNSNPFNEFITVRVTDNSSGCYADIRLQLETATQPNINQPDELYACNIGNGYAEFDTSLIEQELIGSQTGLTIQYYDINNNPLPSPLPSLFQNTEPFSQTIYVRVEYVSNPICYSETSFKLIVNDLPEIDLEDEYFICNLEPSILLNVNSGFNSYNWYFEDGTLFSSTNSGEITGEGNYTLTVTQIENGITCENSFDFTLIRSVLPEIQQINFGELGNNYIEIIASGDGDFEYSIDGINYQDSNYFSNIQGGIYTVFVKDKDGCGQDSEEVTVIDYPKFFTPNNDGYNDFWQIKGIVNFPNSKTLIFDRYGKLLTIISSNEIGWNGQYNGKQMMSNDYWFRTDLGDGKTFSGHFSLKR
jgi:gliding motility-associated-like protein